MGYGSTVQGHWDIKPFLTAKELRGHPELTGAAKKRPDRERDAFLVIEKSVELTEDGENVKVFSRRVEALHGDEEYSRYGLGETLDEIVNAFPDHEFTGRMVCHGEDGEWWAFVVKDHKVHEIRPTVVWPDDDDI